eukprot:4165962-Prymnesium_polylepis.2
MSTGRAWCEGGRARRVHWLEVSGEAHSSSTESVEIWKLATALASRREPQPISAKIFTGGPLRLASVAGCRAAGRPATSRPLVAGGRDGAALG